jgi:hypothetical protein
MVVGTAVGGGGGGCNNGNGGYMAWSVGVLLGIGECKCCTWFGCGR